MAQENNHENNGADEEEDMEIDDSSGVTLNQTHWNHEVHARGASFGFSAPFMASYYRCVQNYMISVILFSLTIIIDSWGSL